jgi:hypothetical protein
LSDVIVDKLTAIITAMDLNPAPYLQSFQYALATGDAHTIARAFVQEIFKASFNALPADCKAAADASLDELHRQWTQHPGRIAFEDFRRQANDRLVGIELWNLPGPELAKMLFPVCHKRSEYC